MGKHKYSNENITVGWDSQTCIHSGVCVKNLSSVFDLDKKPWVNVDGDTAENIVKLIDTCPSGALSYKLQEDEEAKIKTSSKTSSVKISLASNGPYLVKGEIELRDSEGNIIETKVNSALCRCGASSNKPFCDGSHMKTGFSA